MSRSGSSSTSADFDVCVVGAGPAGCVSAAHLAKAGLSVALLAPRRETSVAAGETIPPAAVFILEEIAGQSLDLAEYGQLPWLGRRSAWGSHDLHDHSALFDVQGHGWRIGRPALEDLLRALAQGAGVEVLDGWRLAPRAPTRCDGGWRLDVLDPGRKSRRLRAGTLIDASGRKACALRYLDDAGKRETFDQLVALVMDFPQHGGGPGDSDSTSLVEAVADGYWYSVLGPDDRRIVALYTDSDLLTPDAMREPKILLQKLQETVHMRAFLEGCVLGNPLAKPRIRAASSSRRPTVAGDRWYAVGDAAMTYDPIGSQGIYTAMRLALEVSRSILRESPRARKDFQDVADNVWDRYLFSLCECYFAAGAEGPWADRPFWRRRDLGKLNRWHCGRGGRSVDVPSML